MALLDIRNLRIDIKTPSGLIRIVDNVSLTLNEGEICGLVGESGSGKSLIAKVICNAFKDSWIVTADRFRFNDIELLKLTPTQRRKIVGKEISMVFQDPLTCLDPSQKIGKQLIQSIPGWTFKGHWWQRLLGWRKRRAIELLHRVGIKEQKDIMSSYPHELTEGEGQKVMIASAVANSISEWCNSFIVLYCGQNAESGPKESILENPHHPYTQALLHSIPDFTQPLPFKGHLGTLKGTVPLLEQMPMGCRLGPRCPFAQKKCIVKPTALRIKQHEFFCHFPINLREKKIKEKELIQPLILSTDKPE